MRLKEMKINIPLFWNSIKNSNLKPSVEVQVSDFEAAGGSIHPSEC